MYSCATVSVVVVLSHRPTKQRTHYTIIVKVCVRERTRQRLSAIFVFQLLRLRISSIDNPAIL